MTSPAPVNPFYFKWVDESDTTFDPATMLVEDEDILTFAIKHDEGQFATLDLTIRNPRIGLLNAGRKLHAWFSYIKDDGTTVVPLFFGVLVGVPTDMFAEMVLLKFNARPHDYVARKQTVAEGLKQVPYFHPVFLDEAHRDDPDALLEGWSRLYHIDRITHAVTTSDILEGEDGTITFDQTQGIYESLKMSLGECPLDVVQVRANVQWTQRCSKKLDKEIDVNVSSYTGGSFKSDWPTPGTELGGGWKCESSYVQDVLGTNVAKSVTNSSSAQNLDPDADDCSYDSTSSSVTTCAIPGLAIDETVEQNGGLCDPFGIPFSQFIAEDAFDPDFIPEGVNIPLSVNVNGTMALLWQLNCKMNLRYEAKREFYEQVTINVGANVQATVTSPTVEQNTEVMKVSGVNVGIPLLNVNAWSDFAGRFVGVSQMIRPNDRTRVGGESYQVCITAGVAGTVEPFFSDLPGVVTTDGTVQWACIGDSPPGELPSWSDSTPTAIGEIVLYEPKQWSDTTGAFELTGESCYLLAIEGGFTNREWVQFTYTPTATDNESSYLDEKGNVVSVAQPVNTAYIPAPGQTSPYDAPIIATGQLVVDGGMRWLSLGTTPAYLGIPIGGTTEEVTARSFFTGPSGFAAIKYLICKARARLRLRARCIHIQWDAPFEDCLGLSLRKNATILDGRIPGGAATGKITSYLLSGDKDGKLMGHIEIGVAVGFGNSVSDVTGTPEYTTATGYMQPGYQRYDGGQFAIADGDISFTPPFFKPFDDGLAFPLQDFPGKIVMTQPDQVAAVEKAISSLGGGAFVAANSFPINSVLNKDGVKQTSLALGDKGVGEFLQDINPKERALEAAPVTCEIIIPPVTNGPFNGAIFVSCSRLEIPQGVNLSASSS